jgi:3-oxo-5alpha-steroid 4-dehydrogenase
MLVTEINPNDELWFSEVEAPQIITDPNLFTWDDEADLVIAGLGGAGIAAANEALEQNLTVIGIDKTTGGGATAKSGGVFYAGGGTPIQLAAGVKDSPENMFNYLIQETDNIVKESTLRKFCNTSAENTQWLLDNGVQFDSSYCKVKTSYPGAGYFLYHSDNSLVPSYMEKAEPAPRGHRGYEEGPFRPIGVGGTIYYPLKKSAIKKGLKIFSQTEARSLIITSEGRVVGMKVLMLPSGKLAKKHKSLTARGEMLQMLLPPSYPGSNLLQLIGGLFIKRAQRIEQNHRQVKYIKAKMGVCLSTGGFIFNRSMVKEYAPKYYDGMPLGTPNDQGSGIRLGQSVGGKTQHMDRVTAWRFLNPPLAFAQGIVVNKNGQRFCNEMVYGATLGDAMCESNGGKAYLILDETLFQEAKKQAKQSLPFQRDMARMLMFFNAKKKANLIDLAKVYSLPADILSQEVEKYNEAARSDLPCEFGKASSDIKELNGPFYIMDISIDSKLAPLTTLTLGGLMVNEETGEVLNQENAEIKGLYAAGRTAVGVCSNIYVSGLSIADCIFSGRRIGQHLGKGNRG